MEVSQENKIKVERISDLELVVTRTVDAPSRLVFEAFTNPELFRRWWVPKSYGLNLVSCTLDVRVGGSIAWSSFTKDRRWSSSARTWK